MLALLVGVGVAFAASLPGSNFEIDNNANLKVDGTVPPSLDWANVDEDRKKDLTSGAGDNSFGNGTKEDTPVPSVVSGSIPPNKSDLLNFGAYLETTSSGARYLNVFWHRVQEPSGTTNMDFEFNQSSTISGNGTTPVRTAGDVLIQYDLSQGGTNPQLFLSRWLTSGAGSLCEASNSTPCWSKKTNLSAAGDATGSINTTAIPALESDGLGAISPRTFGEAQIDFDALTGGSGNCVSFGSAYLKSRSSDSFTAALKDFIAPVPTNIGNCAKVTIRKETNPEENPNATNFGFTKTFPTGVASPNTFTLQDDGVKSYGDVKQGTNYVVDEDVIPAGWDLENIDCNVAGRPSSGVAPVIDVAAGTVTFSIDSAADVLDCTYTNTKRGKILIDKVTDPSGDPQKFDFTLKDGPSALNQSFQLADQDPKHDSGLIKPGNGYNAAETVPTGWDLTSATCTIKSPVTNIDVSAGETVTCTFNNTKQRGKILIDKVTDPGSDPQKFDFTLKGGPSALNQSFQLADQDPKHDSGAVLAGNGYNAAETVPTGWDLTSATCDDNSPVTNISVSANETVTCTFTNTKQGKILIDKVTDPSGDPQKFDFTLKDGPSALNQSFQLADQDPKHDSGLIKPGNGYNAAETVPAGWDLTSATCNDQEPRHQHRRLRGRDGHLHLQQHQEDNDHRHGAKLHSAGHGDHHRHRNRRSRRTRRLRALQGYGLLRHGSLRREGRFSQR